MSIQTFTRDTDRYGRTTHTAARPQPHCVAGGFRMAYTDWVRTEDGWDCDFDFEGLRDTVYGTHAECQAAIDAGSYFAGQAMQVAA